MRRLALICLLASACSGGGGGAAGPGPLPASELRRKLLDYQAVKFPQRQFVVGLGAGSTLEAATEAAFGEITRQLTWLPAGSQDLLRGMYRVERSATDTDGQVQLLASLEREAAAAHLTRLARQSEQAAKQRLPDCQRLLKAGEIEEAGTCLSRGTADLGRTTELLAAARAAVGDQARPNPLPIQDQYNELSHQASAGRTNRRSLLLRVIKEIDGRGAGDLDEPFASAITDAGFKRADAEVDDGLAGKALASRTAALLKIARAAGAGYAVVGRIRARFLSEDSGQFFAMANGVVRLLETTGGRSVAELTIGEIKGGHISREQAVEKAVALAAQRLIASLKQKLGELPR